MLHIEHALSRTAQAQEHRFTRVLVPRLIDSPWPSHWLAHSRTTYICTVRSSPELSHPSPTREQLGTHSSRFVGSGPPKADLAPHNLGHSHQSLAPDRSLTAPVTHTASVTQRAHSRLLLLTQPRSGRSPLLCFTLLFALSLAYSLCFCTTGEGQQHDAHNRQSRGLTFPE